MSECSPVTSDPDIRRKERRAMAREICLHRGENPNTVDRGGCEGWEKYEPLAGAVIREAERLFAARPSAGSATAQEFPYQQTFDAIAAATELWPSKEAVTGISISVRKFQEAFNGHRDANLPVGVAQPSAASGSPLADAIKVIRDEPCPFKDGPMADGWAEAWATFLNRLENVDGLNDLYASSRPVDLAQPSREAVIEECAKICDGLRRKDYSGENEDWIAGTSDCAAAIRDLALSSTQSQSGPPIVWGSQTLSNRPPEYGGES